MTDTRADRARAAAQQRQATPPDDTPPGTDLVQRDPLAKMLDSWKPEIKKQFPLQLKINPDAWMRMALTGMRNSKQAVALARCDRPSLYAALLEAARYGLTPFTDEAAVVPYGKTATFIPMAQGFVRMFWNTGQVSGVVTDFIRKGEVRGRDWEIIRGNRGDHGFWHKPRYTDEETGEPVKPGEPILAYFYLEFKDGSVSPATIVTRWDAEEVMTTKSKAWQYAESTGKRDSLWHTDFNSMWAKTAVRRGAKYGPKSAELQELLLVEAREDRTRADAMPVTVATPPDEEDGGGIDWSRDVAGGNVTPGTVIHEEGDKGGSGNGTQAPAGPGAPARNQQPSRAAIAKITSLFKAQDLGGTAHETARRAIITGMIAPEPMTEILKPQTMTVDDLKLAADRLDEFIKGMAGGEDPRTPRDQLLAYAGHITGLVQQAQEARTDGGN
jgi:recombination protein RecT